MSFRKSIIPAIVVLVAVFEIQAQPPTWTVTPAGGMFANNFPVGIGTGTPASLLHLHQDFPAGPQAPVMLRFSQGAEDCTGAGRLFLHPGGNMAPGGNEGDFILWANGVPLLPSEFDLQECGRNLVLASTHMEANDDFGMIRLITGDGFNDVLNGTTEKMSVFSITDAINSHTVIDVKNGSSPDGNSVLRFYNSTPLGDILNAGQAWTIGLDQSDQMMPNRLSFAFGEDADLDDPEVVIAPWGNIGQGVEFPAAKLHMRQNGGDAGSWISMEDNAGNFGYSFFKHGPGHALEEVLSLSAYDNRGGTTWEWQIMAFTLDGNVGVGTGTPLARFHVEGNSFFNGNVGIGTNNPVTDLHVDGRVVIGQDGHTLGDFADPELAVQGTIVAQEVVVVADGWADFVFEEDYELMPLNELEASIAQNGHLPGVPSEEEVAANGVSLNDLQVTLLQKVEELTLYVLELNDKNQQLQQQVAKLQAARNTNR